MKTKVQFIIGLCLMLINGTILFAQRYDFKIDELYSKKYVQTPEMNTIKQIALSSVNYSTGGIDIRIPLYDIECGDLTLPIYLSYNSTGIKVNEPCGWAGLKTRNDESNGKVKSRKITHGNRTKYDSYVC